MKLTFLGTRGYIEESTRRHRRHSSLLIAYRKRRLMIDCGEDWRDHLAKVSPDAILLTHAHPDHAWGLDRGAPCPVYGTAETWNSLQRYPVSDRRVIHNRSRFDVGDLSFEAFPVVHSLHAPAVGFRITGGRTALFYVPDVVDIPDRHKALAQVALYIGDGASPTRPLIRHRGGSLFGHTTIRAQLGWCQAAGISKAVFTHCGSEIVTGDGRKIGAQLRAMGRIRNVEVRIAHDGLQLMLR